MKPHYPILDGLRGTAALLVVIFHLFEGYYPVFTDHPIHHGYLAVDFFFLLSGFVIGYAYDDRWQHMTLADFFKIRLIRLHPLVIISLIIGFLAYWFDPFADTTNQASFAKLLGVLLISFILLPHPDVRTWGETHSLNGPLWSLLQEYIANLLYATFGYRLSKVLLWIIVIISGVTLTVVATWRGDVATGWGYSTFWIGVVRMMFPFFAGLLLFRVGKLIYIPNAYIVCSLLLILLFCIPTLPFNGLYEAFCITIVFPLIVSIGAGSQISGRWAKLCKFSGAISYPIYILHYPFIYLYTEWIYTQKPEPRQIFLVASGLFIFFILLSYLVLKLYDEPVRAWLKEKYLSRCR